MTIKIGNYSVEYSNYDINDDIKSGEAIISTGSSSDEYHFISDGILFLDGSYWRIPGIAVGGNGNDSYYIENPEFAVIADASSSGSNGDYLSIWAYAQNITHLFSVEGRHVFVQTYWGASALIVDGLNSRGSIETIDFFDLRVNGSPSSMQSLVETYKTSNDQTFDNLIYNGLFRPNVMGVNSAEELRSIIDGINEISESKVLNLNVGSEYKLSGIRDFDGTLHGGADPSVRDNYKYQGSLDINGDSRVEAIFTNADSKRWATININPLTNTTNYEEHQTYGTTRIVGIYIDPLVTSGDVVQFSDHDSQYRFQNDLKIDNLLVKAAGDYDSDGIHEVYWKTADGTAYLRSLMHDDGNIRYANYQSEDQMSEYLTAQGHADVINDIV
ncbi:hypothetical protein [uncultured Prochlorococcus sp.]|uniref:hypothetical protein n=1 Tax=uncultured Prochlorococcus sp. TaxID=159733 RepID=UPI00258C4E93|nr:hypothetical protein [uncultured Prochlorococcus sp.]